MEGMLISLKDGGAAGERKEEPRVRAQPCGGRMKDWWGRGLKKTRGVWTVPENPTRVPVSHLLAQLPAAC